MQRFKSILLVDPGRKSRAAALERASALARTNSARLTAVSVLDEIPAETLRLLSERRHLDLKQLAMEECASELEAWVAAARSGGLEVETRALSGTPHVELVRQVLRGGHDLVMIVAAGEPGLFYGATAAQLLRKCPCPVWVMKPGAIRRYARVMAAVDPDSTDPAKKALARKILELASSLAKLEQGELHVASAWTLAGETLLRRRAGLTVEELEELRHETEEANLERLQKLLKGIDVSGVPVKLRMLHGDPSEKIPELANKRRISVVVMGTVGRSGIKGVFIGNTAERILNQISAALLAVKPDGFVSPIKA